MNTHKKKPLPIACSRERCKYYVKEKNYCELKKTVLYPYEPPLCNVPLENRGITTEAQDKPILIAQGPNEPNMKNCVAVHFGPLLYADLNRYIDYKETNRSAVIRKAVYNFLELELKNVKNRKKNDSRAKNSR